MINAAPASVTVVLEEGLAAAKRVNVHPLRNTATLGLPGTDILRLLAHWGLAPLVAAIPTVPELPPLMLSLSKHRRGSSGHPSTGSG